MSREPIEVMKVELVQRLAMRNRSSHPLDVPKHHIFLFGALADLLDCLHSALHFLKQLSLSLFQLLTPLLHK